MRMLLVRKNKIMGLRYDTNFVISETEKFLNSLEGIISDHSISKLKIPIYKDMAQVYMSPELEGFNV